ncbi:hypothetical protein [Sphingomonas sp.]|uniref:alpha/beta hydrolase n=1 Tax=Sphingomonas sp. TaxID=28214 RepID=UPI00286DA387|nr:hypothetical protein [Sphingomonas sp.]
MHVGRLFGLAMAAVLLALPAPGPAAPSGKLAARPSAGVTAAPPGIARLINGAVAYRPATARPGPLPLLVLLHGSDGKARRFLDLFRPLADAEGYALLALQSAAWDWDIGAAVAEQMRRGTAGKVAPDFGRDPARIDAVLAQYFAANAVDRIVLVGFSDGAAYALSLGLANPELFPAVVALSPGFVKLPPEFGPGQRVFIAHGRSDRVLPFATGRQLAEVLARTSLSVRFHPFDGDHVISRAALDAGLAFALDGTG